jgi:hypothetical protein
MTKKELENIARAVITDPGFYVLGNLTFVHPVSLD